MFTVCYTDVLEICQSKGVTKNDVNEFEKHLDFLIKNTSSFDINGDDYTDSLLIV